MSLKELELEKQALLKDLKCTVESLLISQVTNVWNVYGGLNRLHQAMERIFRHQCKVFIAGSDEPDVIVFIQGLDWLQPSSISVSNDFIYHPHLPTHLKNDKASIWLYKSLENHTLSQKLSWLISDKPHLLACYEPTAFLCQEKFCEATLICLRSIEQYQPSLLSEINPTLFLTNFEILNNSTTRAHRRSSSFPIAGSWIQYNSPNEERILEEDEVDSKFRSVGKLKPWNSLTDLKIETEEIKTPATSPNSPMQDHSPQRKFSPSVLNVDYDKVHIDTTIYVENEVTPPQKSEKMESSDAFSISSMPIRKIRNIISGSEESPFLNVLSGHNLPKKSFIEDGGSSITPMATGYFPRPLQGQSLASFLSSGQFSHASAELDRENAHFNISEAMIAAIEQVKFNNRILGQNTTEEQRVRIRRKKVPRKQRIIDDSLSDTTTLTPRSSSDSDHYESTDFDDLDVESASNLADSRSLSLASLYTNSDVMKRPREAPDGQSDCVLSAESVALSLISKYKPKQLPKASDLIWLVSESDVKQELLPLPTSWPINPDGAMSPDRITPLRGTMDWAPPRPQVIFTPHPKPKLQVVMAKQNNRCASCGMRVAQQYASKFRYCEYLGRYFCTGCHNNQLAMIPGRILQSWDFSRYPVSIFSYRLLEQMSSDPLFSIAGTNPDLYRKNRSIAKARVFRLQLFYLKDFIANCRFADKVQDVLERDCQYMLTDPEVYSIDDLCAVKKGDLLIRLKEKVETALLHVNNCDLCKARGFICEKCKSNDIIFPWQLNKVSKCNVCGACYHQTCWPSQGAGPCKRCLRIKQRRDTRQEEKATAPIMNISPITIKQA